MTVDDSQQTPPGPTEAGGEPQKRKQTWLMCCCAGCAVTFITFVVAGLLYWSLLTTFLREILVSR